MKLMGNNADGILNKLESLENILATEKPSAIFLQETKTGRSGRIKTPSSRNYTWYELCRSEKAEKGVKGGGVAIGVLNSLDPSWISEGNDEAEAITVEIWIEGFPVRLICGYGPQENDSKTRKEHFWHYLQNEVRKGKENGAGVVIQMDGNLWAGSEIVKGDPKLQNQNGKYFKDFLDSNPNLTVTNALKVCEGKITRSRHTCKGTQESILDFFLVCEKLLPLVTKLTIDEKGETALVRYKGKVVKSDHRMLKLELNLQINNRTNHKKVEIFNFRNKKCQQLFKENTSKDNVFTKCFANPNEPVEVQFKRWKRLLKKSVQTSFQKIRIKENRCQSKLDTMMNERKLLLKKKVFTKEDEKKVELIENEISDEVADKEYKKIKNIIGEIETEGGTTNNTNIWKELRKAYPKKSKPIPTGVKNIQGKVITNPKEKKKVIINHFEHRMRKRKAVEDAKSVIEMNEEIFRIRLKEANENKSKEFDMKELEKVLKSLKTNKSSDPEGLINELFKEEAMGSDLKESVLMMMNRIKVEMKLPQEMKKANITILHKKNCRLDLSNWRGIFVTSVLRTILMKLVHERTYKTIDENMSEAQIGARKKKSVRNHLFVVKSIINDVMSSNKKEPIDINIMDFKQMFDTEELPIVLNAFYEGGVKNDMLGLIHAANVKNSFAVKTPNGLTEERIIENKIMQGDVLGPLVSSQLVDRNIAQVAISAGNVYMYKKNVAIPPLIMMDDTITVSTCGNESRKISNLINTQTNIMKLQFGADKCVKLHVGKTHNTDKCAKPKVDVWKDVIKTNDDGRDELVDEYGGKTEIKEVKDKKYLGEILTSDNKNEKNIKDKLNKATGNVNKIIDSITERPYGKHKYKAAKLMRDGMIVTSMLANAETWTNMLERDIEKLNKPDKMFLNKLLGEEGNPSLSFMYLEMGMVPLKYVLIGKRLKFLKYILDEDEETMVNKVYKAMKEDSKVGDFVDLIKKDMKTVNINLTDDEIKEETTIKWKTLVNKEVKNAALQYLKTENNKKTKTKDIDFESLEMSEYLARNKNSKLTKYIFKVRSGTLGIKEWCQWKFEDNLCVGCELKAETISHFMQCSAQRT